MCLRCIVCDKKLNLANAYDNEICLSCHCDENIANASQDDRYYREDANTSGDEQEAAFYYPEPSKREMTYGSDLDGDFIP